jgi:molybdopterin-guanine dinucleotide biosynthesis protein A
MTENLPSAAVILAGGRGSRLGTVDKARLRVGGRTLLEWVLTRVRPQARRVAIATSGQVPVVGGDAVATIRDATSPPIGPLGGLAAAGAWTAGFAATSETVLSAPADTPLFPEDFATRALALLEPGIDAVVGGYGEDTYPVCALWRLAPLVALKADLDRNAVPGSVFAWLDGLRWRRVDYAPWVADSPFVNANTATDLVRLSGRLDQARAAGASTTG